MTDIKVIPRLCAGIAEKCLDLEQKLDLERSEKARLEENIQEYQTIIGRLQVLQFGGLYNFARNCAFF